MHHYILIKFKKWAIRLGNGYFPVTPVSGPRRIPTAFSDPSAREDAYFLSPVMNGVYLLFTKFIIDIVPAGGYDFSILKAQ